MLVYIEQASVLIPEHVAYESVLAVLVRCWAAAVEAGEPHVERLPGPPQMTIEDYHTPSGRSGLKLVTVSGPGWINAGEN